MIEAASISSRVFAGEYRHGLDPKHRITIPSRWRTGEAEDFFIMPHQELPCAVVMPPGEFGRVRDAALERLAPEKQAVFLRMFASRAVICPADKQGRMVLPEEMRGRFGFAGEVVLVGGAVRFEIWVPSEWAAFQAAHEEGFKEVAQRVGL